MVLLNGVVTALKNKRFTEVWNLPGATFTRFSTEGGQGKVEFNAEDVTRGMIVKIVENFVHMVHE